MSWNQCIPQQSVYGSPVYFQIAVINMIMILSRTKKKEKKLYERSEMAVNIFLEYFKAAVNEFPSIRMGCLMSYGQEKENRTKKHFSSGSYENEFFYIFNY